MTANYVDNTSTDNLTEIPISQALQTPSSSGNKFARLMNENRIQLNEMNNADDTMEPLLENNNDENENPYKIVAICKCKQPGFDGGTIARNPSAESAKLKIIFAILLCSAFMIVEFLGGYLAGSLAIMADAAHLATDCISFIIGLLAICIARKPPDNVMSFGYQRMEVIGAVVSILSIWILTATLVLVAIQRLYWNDFDLDANTMMQISGIGILINIVMAYILHGSCLPAMPTGSHFGHSHSHSHKMTNSENNNRCKDHEENLNLRAALIHVIGDLVQSVGVFIASIVIKYFPQAKFADPLCTLLFSMIVILTTTKLFKDSMTILIDAVPTNISLINLKRDLSQIEGVKSVHHLNVWNNTVNHSIMMVHLVVGNRRHVDSDEILLEASNLASSSKYNIKHSTIQIEHSDL